PGSSPSAVLSCERCRLGSNLFCAGASPPHGLGRVMLGGARDRKDILSAAPRPTRLFSKEGHANVPLVWKPAWQCPITAAKSPPHYAVTGTEVCHGPRDQRYGSRFRS